MSDDEVGKEHTPARPLGGGGCEGEGTERDGIPRARSQVARAAGTSRGVHVGFFFGKRKTKKQNFSSRALISPHKSFDFWGSFRFFLWGGGLSKTETPSFCVCV